MNASGLNSSGEGSPFRIVPFGAAVFFGGGVSMFTNFCILVAVVKSKALSSKCYQLMGNLALADLVSSLGFLVYGSLVALGWTAESGRALPNRLCFYLNVPFVLSFPAGSFMILAIGSDRLLAVAMPIAYKSIRRRRYVWGINGAAWVFGLPFLIIGWLSVDESLVPACVLPTALQGAGLNFFSLASFCINMAVVGVYTATLALTRRMSCMQSVSRAQSRQCQRTTRVMRSLVLVMVVFVGSWFITIAVILTTTVIFPNTSPVTQFHAALYVGILANVNVGSNFFIYAARSEEYRKFFLWLFGLSALCGKRTASTWYLSLSSRLSSRRVPSGRDGRLVWRTASAPLSARAAPTRPAPKAASVFHKPKPARGLTV